MSKKRLTWEEQQAKTKAWMDQTWFGRWVRHKQKRGEEAKADNVRRSKITWEDIKKENQNKPFSVLGSFFFGGFCGIAMFFLGLIVIGVGSLLCATVIGIIVGLPLILMGVAVCVIGVGMPFHMAHDAMKREQDEMVYGAELKRIAKEEKEAKEKGIPYVNPREKEKQKKEQEELAWRVAHEKARLYKEQVEEKIKNQVEEKIAEEKEEVKEAVVEQEEKTPVALEKMTVDLGHGKKVPFMELPKALREQLIKQCEEEGQNPE